MVWRPFCEGISVLFCLQTFASAVAETGNKPVWGVGRNLVLQRGEATVARISVSRVGPKKKAKRELVGRVGFCQKPTSQLLRPGARSKSSNRQAHKPVGQLPAVHAAAVLDVEQRQGTHLQSSAGTYIHDELKASLWACRCWHAARHLPNPKTYKTLYADGAMWTWRTTSRSPLATSRTTRRAMAPAPWRRPTARTTPRSR